MVLVFGVMFMDCGRGFGRWLVVVGVWLLVIGAG